MTVVNTETGELIDVMSAAEAEVVTDAISWRLDQLATAHEEVMPMIRDALARRAWDALGYRSPGDYAADRFGGALTRLSIPVRQAVVQELTDAGMSTRAIAPVVGASQKTVDRDRRAGESHDSPDQTPQGEARADSGRPVDSDRPQDAAAPRPAVTGVDGKTYTRPAPVDTKAQVRAAVAEFPDLAHFAEHGPDRDVLNMADDLRRFRQRGELDMRLDNLRRAIAVDKAKRAGTYRPGTTAVMGDDGEYRMAPLPTPAPTARTCPTCSGRGVIQE